MKYTSVFVIPFLFHAISISSYHLDTSHLLPTRFHLFNHVKTFTPPWAYAERGRGGGSCPSPPGFWVKVYLGSRRALFLNSCQLQSLQLPAAFKKGCFFALVARNFQIFSRSRANPQQKCFCGRRARKFIIAFTCIMYSCMLQI